jgi:hypothetical protein
MAETIIGTNSSQRQGQTCGGFHRYLYPQRDMPADAVVVHGLTAEFPGGFPVGRKNSSCSSAVNVV